ncbi:MAG: hypothetical protein JRF37_12060, partial [Deltaproteobacteria bacterium]|nr:hypothetical protein [Deltaproteobacteria bacterium]
MAGQRGGVPWPFDLCEKGARYLFIGSSITFGWGVPAQKAFAEIVRRELDKAFSELAFDVINAGVPGYSSYQGLNYLKKILPRYQPDLVIAEFGINDGTMATGKMDKDWTPGFSDTFSQLIRKSGWGRLFLRLFKGLAPEKSIANQRQGLEQARKSFYRVSLTGNKTRVAPADFKTNLQQMASLCREENASFFVYIPSLYNEYGEGLLTLSVNIMMPDSIPVHQAILPHSPGVL